MPVLALFTARVTKAQYDMLRQELDSENKYPVGAIFHAACFDDHGQVHVADVWASADDLNAYVQNHLMPAFAKHQITPPSVVIHPAHKVLAYKEVEKFQV